MKRITTLLLSLLMLSFSAVVHAAGSISSQVQVTSVETISSNGALIFRVSATRTPPSCVGASYPSYWIISSSATADTQKAQFNTVMLAYSQGRPITVYGTGFCSSVYAIEIADDIILQ